MHRGTISNIVLVVAVVFRSNMFSSSGGPVEVEIPTAETG